MSLLDSRKVRILQAIVNDYVLTSKPVGSERLIEIYNMGCKSATIRNEMAEMAEMGYLQQPHTSAGRIPTDRGYRYYVDELMDRQAALTPGELLQAQMAPRPDQAEIDQILRQTCVVLARLTSCASLATDLSSNATTIRHVYLAEADARHLLLIILLSNGHVGHRLLEMDALPSTSTLQMLSNYIHAVVVGCDLDDVGRAIRMRPASPDMVPYYSILNRAFAALSQAAQVLSERRIFLEGTNQLLRQPEFHDVQRLESLLNALEQRRALHQMLSQALNEYETTILIGAENGWESMQDCSIIMRSYRIGDRTVGYLGVVGPTRMHYDRIAAAVNLMAQNLSSVLTNLSLA